MSNARCSRWRPIASARLRALLQAVLLGAQWAKEEVQILGHSVPVAAAPVPREGFPVLHWLFSGNTVGVSTVAQVKRNLRDWQRTRCLFVGGAGMVSAANFNALAAGREAVMGDGKRRLRYGVCFNPEEAAAPLAPPS